MSLVCPVCGKRLFTEEGVARCESGHAFDRARSGYWNLLMDQASHGHGDDKAMLRARRAFLSGGWYAPLTDAVSAIAARVLPDGGTAVDAGCGEGAYTLAAADALAAAGKKHRLFAFDVSKEAARMTASLLRERGTVFVASAYRIPMESGCADLVISVFSPFARAEFARILRPGGTLLRVVPEPDHLRELKEAVYDAPRSGPAGREEGDGAFLPGEEIPVRKTLDLPGAALTELFDMTPYARKTAPRDREKLLALPGLSVTMACRVLLSTKNSCEGNERRV